MAVTLSYDHLDALAILPEGVRVALPSGNRYEVRRGALGTAWLAPLDGPVPRPAEPPTPRRWRYAVGASSHAVDGRVPPVFDVSEPAPFRVVGLWDKDWFDFLQQRRRRPQRP